MMLRDLSLSVFCMLPFLANKRMHIHIFFLFKHSVKNDAGKTLTPMPLVSRLCLCLWSGLNISCTGCKLVKWACLLLFRLCIFEVNFTKVVRIMVRIV